MMSASFLFVVVFGVLIAFVIAVQQTPLPQGRPIQFRLRTLLGLVVGCAALFALPKWLSDVADLKSLIVLGTPLVYQIDQYYNDNGYYPDCLKDASIESPESAFGKFQYARDIDGGGYSLTIDMHHFGEILCWDSISRSWGTDMRLFSEIGWSEAEVKQW